MNFAINAALRARDRAQATIEMTTELLRPALLGEPYQFRGQVVRLTRHVGFGEAVMTNAEDKLVSRSTGTFLLHRAD